MKQIALITMIVLLASCNQAKQSNDTANTPEEPAKPSWSLELVWESDTLLSTSESVLYDKAGEQLIVTCINGAPWEKDGKGFLALLNMDGSIKAAPWVEGLDAPKGSGLYDGLLYVADMDQVVVVDMEKAEISQRIPLEGAQQLNDVAVDSDGTVYVSDSQTGWIWTLKDGQASPWIKEGFDRPNGLLVEEDRVLLATSGSHLFQLIDKESAAIETATEGIGAGDGIAFTGKEGHYLVSSWEGELFLILPDYSKVELLDTREQEMNTADIGFNAEAQLVYVPTFYDNRVVAYRLKAED